MIEQLPENELLEFLLTSEFEEEYRPNEFRYLLHKFRSFYRVLHGRNSNIVGQKDLEIKHLRMDLESMSKSVEKIQIENATIINEIDLKPSTRKLTLMERIRGVIDLKK